MQRGQRERERFVDSVLLALKMEEVATAKEWMWSIEFGKAREWILCLSIQKDCHTANSLILGLLVSKTVKW